MTNDLFPDTPTEDAPSEPRAPRRSRWRRIAAAWPSVFRRNRTLWIVAAAAVVAMVAGLLVGRFVISPADAAAGAAPPEAGLVTVPVGFGQLSNDVTIRGEVGFADPVEVEIDTSALSGPAVVTGQVPAVGSELKPLSIALELAGRPVIVLPGELPAYRSLRVGVSGPDVAQFKQAMREVGLDAGDPANNVFDAQAAQSIPALYAQAGYPAPAAEDGAGQAVSGAEQALRSAEQALRTAQAELSTAKSGADEVQKREADNAVSAARRELDAVRARTPDDTVSIGNLEDALGLAELRRRQLDRPGDTTAQRSAVESANAALTQAQADLDDAREAALPFLPAGEVLYLTELPRRVDAVTARRGAVLENPAMTVSGATMALTGSAARADAELLTVGEAASFELADGATHAATITAVEAGADDAARWTVRLTPAPMTAEQVQQLQGTNVRVAIPVGATAGEVLNVPLAALTAGPGGESRVEVVESDPREGDRAKTRLVTVTTGLAADGAVEITPTEGELREGELVVVGR